MSLKSLSVVDPGQHQRCGSGLVDRLAQPGAAADHLVVKGGCSSAAGTRCCRSPAHQRLYSADPQDGDVGECRLVVANDQQVCRSPGDLGHRVAWRRCRTALALLSRASPPCRHGHRSHKNQGFRGDRVNSAAKTQTAR